eukprot:UN26521
MTNLPKKEGTGLSIEAFRIDPESRASQKLSSTVYAQNDKIVIYDGLIHLETKMDRSIFQYDQTKLIGKGSMLIHSKKFDGTLYLYGPTIRDDMIAQFDEELDRTTILIHPTHQCS